MIDEKAQWRQVSLNELDWATPNNSLRFKSQFQSVKERKLVCFRTFFFFHQDQQKCWRCHHFKDLKKSKILETQKILNPRWKKQILFSGRVLNSKKQKRKKLTLLTREWNGFQKCFFTKINFSYTMKAKMADEMFK